MARQLQVWTPFSELERFRDDFDNLFDRLLGGTRSTTGLFPPIESFIEGDRMIIRADLPGIDPDSVEVTVTGNVLTFKGQRKSEDTKRGRNFIHREIAYGSFERSLTLPEGVRAEDVKASYRNGVLELTLPVPIEMSSRKVPIEVAKD